MSAMTDPRRCDPSILPISEYQRRYWAKWNESPRCTAFNTPLAFEIRGDLDLAAFKQACLEATKTQDITHARFSEDGSEQYHGSFSIDDFYEQIALDPTCDVEAELREIFRRPFDLASGPLVKFYLCSLDDQTHYFVLSAHHIITDARWGPTMISTLGLAYHACVSGSTLEPSAGPSYAACIQRLRASVKPERKQRARAFWRQFLEHAPLTVDLPRTSHAEPEARAAESIFFDLDEDLARATRGFASAHDSTLFIVLSAMFSFLLASYAEQEVVVASYPLDMRPHGFDHVVGCFVNLALMKATVRPHTTLGALVGELTQQRRQVRPHWHFSLRDLVHVGGEIDVDIEKSYFSVFFGETYLNTHPLQLDRLDVRSVNLPWSDEFDRELRLLYDASQSSGIRFRMDYRSTHYDRSVIVSFIEQFRRVLARALVDERSLREIASEA